MTFAVLGVAALVLGAQVSGPYALGIAVVALAAVWLLTRARRNVSASLGPLKVAIEQAMAPVHEKVDGLAQSVEQVNRQVNHVEDPEVEPTLREMICRQSVQLRQIDRRVASVETAQLAQAERLGAIGRLARQTADTLKGVR